MSGEHAALEESAARLARAVAQTTPDMQELARARWQLGYRLAVHLAQEDRHVYPALKAHTNTRIANLAALFEREMGDLDQRFRDHLAAWASDRIASDWPAFVGETRTLLDALARRIRREEQDLYPLIEGPS